ncbi:branched-chain amino acid ABC transporter permease [Nocardioides psychrotolerans]|uniref:Branched-chain amino acid transport system permease protein n=1 Tax=Nocardioides psychrotolerans TaxID=1005945 RepID=A0A1I3RDK2_9ACTN|nr:branched-chain amino acid ABC transporter permease [Nocardioides psychrotolerans]GEP40437.1 branched-chain amino acid ABC transporter permease [Nocardioides psychrotolerans]SFJ44338.1 branched-chain amino acid transport system permease protein [Nocardioides psychrotolerans]
MSDTSTATRLVKGVVLLALLVVLLALPLYVEEFWLRTGFAVFAAIIGAVGLNLLVGTTGQLSLAHAFFLAVGALTYVYVSGDPGGSAIEYGGFGLPPIVGMVAGVVMAGLAGVLFSPIAARLRGIYLGVASLGLVFIGQHLLNTWTSVSGGFNGRLAPAFDLFGFSFGGNEEPYLAVLGVPFGQAERLWYLGLALCALACWFASNLLRSRPGRALQNVRDSEVAASVMGVNVQEYKAKVFLVSSMYAGLAGVLYALSIGSVAPESFSLLLSVQYLAMIVLGGLGSVGGAAMGAAFVSALPLVLQQYSGSLPFIVEPGQPGIVASQAAAFLYGGAIVLVVMFEPGGLAGLARRLKRQPRPPQESPPVSTTSSAPADSSSGGTPR